MGLGSEFSSSQTRAMVWCGGQRLGNFENEWCHRSITMLRELLTPQNSDPQREGLERGKALVLRKVRARNEFPSSGLPHLKIREMSFIASPPNRGGVGKPLGQPLGFVLLPKWSNCSVLSHPPVGDPRLVRQGLLIFTRRNGGNHLFHSCRPCW